MQSVTLAKFARIICKQLAIFEYKSEPFTNFSDLHANIPNFSQILRASFAGVNWAFIKAKTG